MPSRRVHLGRAAGGSPAVERTLRFLRSGTGFPDSAFRWGTPTPFEGKNEVRRVSGQGLRPLGPNPIRILDSHAEPALGVVQPRLDRDDVPHLQDVRGL